MAELVRTAESGPVRTLTLNRPEVLNSFNGALHESLLRALEAVARDTSVRCLVLAGAGRAFCAGQDLSDPHVAPDPAEGAAAKDLGAVIERFYKPLVERLRSLPVPTIAAVHGVAAGAGANLALNCDLVLAGASAAFIQAFSKVGLIPDTGGTWLLPRLVGRARALGLTMLGEKLSAADAERIGLIWKAVPDEALSGEVQRVALQLASLPTKALAATRRLIDESPVQGLDLALAAERDAQRELGFAHDYREGVAAFLAKRPPRYLDR